MSFEMWWKDYCRNHDSTPSFGTVFEAGCAESEAQITTLQLERDALREALQQKVAQWRRYDYHYRVGASLCADELEALLFPSVTASGEPARKP